MRSHRQEPIASREAFLVPEPWSGRIESAPILFISANPSTGSPPNPPIPDPLPRQPANLDEGDYPRVHWPDRDIVELFTRRFSGGRRVWIKDGTKERRPDGSFRRAVPFWSSVKARAAELLERPPEPGIDYALTEVVHCKSQGEYGVPEAISRCAANWLGPVLSVSSAKVVVVLGRNAEDAVRRQLGMATGERVVGSFVGGRARLIAFLPHPNARGVRSFAVLMNDEQMARLRAALGSVEPNPRGTA